MEIGSVILLGGIFLVVIYRSGLSKEFKENNLEFYDLKKWSSLKTASWLIFLDWKYLKIYKDLKTWGKEELRVTKALCQKKIPQRNIWSEAIPVVAIIISCGSVFISILGIVFGTLLENQIMQEMAESGIRFDEYAVIFILIIGLATILWFISTIQYIVGNKYKSLLYMCESILEAKENTMIE